MINSGGVASVVKKIAINCCSVDHDFKADIVCYEEPTDDVVGELFKYGIDVIVIDRITKNPVKYFFNVLKILKSKRYNAIHTHIEYFNWIPCFLGKICGVKNRVGHAHGQRGRSNSFLFHFVEYLGRILNCKFTTKRFSCSIASGNYVFGKDDFEFLPNFINVDCAQVLTDAQLKQYRAEFGIKEGALVVGFMGYLGYEKNPSFVAELAKYCLTVGKKFVFLVAGDGHEKQQLIKSSQECINKGVIQFLGYRTDNIALLQMFDVLIMPSHSEGMSMALLESQMFGTPCVVSKGVPNTTDLGVGLYHQAQTFSCEEWVNLISKSLVACKYKTIDERLERLKEIGYDCETVINRILESYKFSS